MSATNSTAAEPGAANRGGTDSQAARNAVINPKRDDEPISKEVPPLSHAMEQMGKTGGVAKDGRIHAIFPDLGIYPDEQTRLKAKNHTANDLPAAEAMKSPAEDFGLHPRIGHMDAAWEQKSAADFPKELVHSWHVHHYFEDGNEESVREGLELRDRVIKEFPNLTVGRPVRQPSRAHPVGFWVIELFSPAQFSQYLPWIMVNHGKLNCLVHMNTSLSGGGEYLDHTDYSFVIGNKNDIPHIMEGVEKRFWNMIRKDPKVDPLAFSKFKAGQPGAKGWFGKGYSKDTLSKM